MHEEYLIKPKHFSVCFIDISNATAYTAYYSMGTVGFLRVQSGQSVKFIAFFQLEARLRKNGILQLFPPQSAFTAWPGTN